MYIYIDSNIYRYQCNFIFLNMKRIMEKTAWPTLVLVVGAVCQPARLAALGMDAWI